MLETGAVLATINAEFHVKYDLPQFVRKVGPGYFLMFSFSLFKLESEESQENRKCVKKMITSENYTRITFVASYRKY